MAEQTSISWATHTFNPWVGCTKVSPACDGCYAEAMMAGRFGRVEWGAPGKGEGTRDRTSPQNWREPKKWDRKAKAEYRTWIEGGMVGPRPTPVFVFCASLADVFDNAVPAEWRRDLFDLIRATPNLTWLLLTKRPGNIVKLFLETCDDEPAPFYDRERSLVGLWPRNAAIGCTVVTQEEADRDIPKLLAAKAALNPAFAFLSMEPLLGPVDLTRLTRPHRHGYGAGYVDALRGWTRAAGHGYREFDADAALDWIITGGETDQGAHKARPADPAWFRSLRDQCAAAGVPFHFKQWGEWQPLTEPGAVPRLPASAAHDAASGCYRAGNANDPCTLDGVSHDARPALGET